MKYKVLLVVMVFLCVEGSNASVRLKDLARIEGVQDNHLVGYGLVIGLSGTGDSSKSTTTIQSLSNTLQKFSLNVEPSDINSRNVASVIVTASLPPFAQVGDKLEIHASSIGDAKSLRGGTLLLTPLQGANDVVYALAQGPLSVGGYSFEYNGNRVQKNHPTVGFIPDGAKVEKSLHYSFNDSGRKINLLLKEADFTTANRVILALKSKFPTSIVETNHPGKISITIPKKGSIMSYMADIESLRINPDGFSRVVVSERNGTVVAGADVTVENVVISHGALKLKIISRNSVSQPTNFVLKGSSNVGSISITNSDLQVKENEAKSIVSNGASIGDLVDAMKALNLSTQDLIAVLQAVKKSGALHADLIIQ